MNGPLAVASLLLLGAIWGTGWAAVEDGVARVSFATNLDDADGDYRLVCADRASGVRISKTIQQK